MTGWDIGWIILLIIICAIIEIFGATEDNKPQEGGNAHVVKEHRETDTT